MRLAMIAVPSHRVIFFAALAVAVTSVVAFGFSGWRAGRSGAAGEMTVQLAPAPYVPARVEGGSLKTDGWNPPSSQSRGREWVYDLFTPPEIFYHARSKQFTVKPPAGFLEDESPESFGLELAAIRPEPFRLQLIGYMGEEGNWRGTFENLASGEVFLGAAGRRVPSLGVTIRSLEVRLQPVAPGQGMVTRQRVATAVVQDERAGREVTITHRERRFTDTLSALVAAPGATATREVRQGEVFKLGDANYRIEKIQLSPPLLEVTKEIPGRAPSERRVLAPREDADADNVLPSVPLSPQ